MLPIMGRGRTQGLVLLGFMAHVRSMVEMVGQLLLDVLRLLKNPLRGPWRAGEGVPA